MKKNKNKIFEVGMIAILLFISFTSAFSVSAPYMENKELIIPIGEETKNLEFVLQNGGGTESINIRARIIEGTEIAEITTAILLDDEYILDISKRLTEMIGKPVVVSTKVDPGLIGGIIIKIGDKVMDGSIKNKLAALQRELGRAAG